MRLLRRSEADRAIKQEQAALATRTLETIKLSKEEAGRLDKLRTEHEAEVRRLKEAFDQEASGIALARAKLQQEIVSLEARREQLEFSVDALRLREREDRVETREKECDTREALYAVWREEIDERANEVSLDEAALSAREAEISRQASLAEKQIVEISTLHTSLLETSMKILERDLQLKTKEKAFEEWHRSFLERIKLEDKALQEQRNSIKEQRRKLQEDERAIRDGYATLANAREKILGRKT